MQEPPRIDQVTPVAIKRHGIMMNVLIVGCGRGGSIGLQFLATLCILRALPTEEAGGFLMSFSVSLFLQLVAQVGLGSAAVPSIGRFLAQGDLAGARGYALLASSIAALVGVLMAVGFAIGGATLLADLIGSPLLAGPLQVMAWSIPCLAFSWVCVEVLRAFERQGQSALLSGMVTNGCQVLILLWLMSRTGNVQLTAVSAAWIFVASAGINALVALACLLFGMPGRGFTFTASAFRLVSQTVPLYVHSVLVLCLTQIDVWIACAMLKPFDAGVYTVASRWVGFLATPNVVLSMALGPRLVAAHHAGDAMGIERQLRMNGFMSLIITVIGYALLLCLSPWLFQTASGVSQEMLLIAACIGLGQIAIPMFGNSFVYLVITDRRWLVARFSLLSIGLMGAACFLGAETGGAVGLAIGMAFSAILYRLAAALYVRWRFGTTTWPSWAWPFTIRST